MIIHTNQEEGSIMYATTIHNQNTPEIQSLTSSLDVAMDRVTAQWGGTVWAVQVRDDGPTYTRLMRFYEDEGWVTD